MVTELLLSDMLNEQASTIQFSLLDCISKSRPSVSMVAFDVVNA
jgi:hypothetical protein